MAERLRAPRAFLQHRSGRLRFERRFPKPIRSELSLAVNEADQGRRQAGGKLSTQKKPSVFEQAKRSASASAREASDDDDVRAFAHRAVPGLGSSMSSIKVLMNFCAP